MSYYIATPSIEINETSQNIDITYFENNMTPSTDTPTPKSIKQENNQKQKPPISLQLSETQLTAENSAKNIIDSKNNKSVELSHINDNDQDEKDENKNKKHSVRISADIINVDLDNRTKTNNDSNNVMQIMQSNISEDDILESKLLSIYGFTKKLNIADTLQGSIFLASNLRNASTVVIKRASKILSQKGISIQKGKIYNVKEDIIKEINMLKFFHSRSNCPDTIIKFIASFQTQNNHYLVMENGGKDFFKFICTVHQLIQCNKLEINEWRKFAKWLFFQMVITVMFLHEEMNCCHLDISLENITVQNANLLLRPDGKYSIDSSIRIKFIDFGLAEFFDSKNNQNFLCDKFCGKTQYKAPEVYAKKIFDGRRADIWSLGSTLFMMTMGCPAFNKPCDKDDIYKYFIQHGLFEHLLIHFKRQSYATKKLLDLLKGMLNVDVNKRFLIKDVYQHSWLNVYYQK